MKKIGTFVAIMVLLGVSTLGEATVGRIVPGLGSTAASAEKLDVQPQQPESPLSPAGNAFTYQGRLTSAGSPANGSYDFQMSLYNVAVNGNALATVTLAGQPVQNGLFTLSLNFDPNLFNGQALWLNVAVRPAGNGNYTVLTPRQELKPAPYAFYAQKAPWTGISGKPESYNPSMPRYSNSAIDTAGVVGMSSSMVIGSDGLGLVSYYDSTNTALNVSHCEDVACTSATVTQVDNSGFVGDWSSITVGADGLGLIAYYDASLSALKVAHCNDIECSQSTISTVDNSANVGQYPSIMLSSDARSGQRYLHGLIAYYDVTNTALKVALCGNVTCTSSVTYTVDNDASVGQYTSITGTIGGNPIISYFDATNGALKVAQCQVTHCMNGTATKSLADDTAGAVVGQYTSITIDSDGYAAITYWDATHGYLKLARCSGVCSSAPNYIIDGGGGTVPVGQYSSVTVGRDGMLLISYYDYSNNMLKVAHCESATCSLRTLLTPAVSGGYPHGQYSSLTIGSDGNPIISYYYEQTQDLMVLHCSNPYCTPHQIRR